MRMSRINRGDSWNYIGDWNCRLNQTDYILLLKCFIIMICKTRTDQQCKRLVDTYSVLQLRALSLTLHRLCILFASSPHYYIPWQPTNSTNSSYLLSRAPPSPKYHYIPGHVTMHYKSPSSSCGLKLRLDDCTRRRRDPQQGVSSFDITQEGSTFLCYHHFVLRSELRCVEWIDCGGTVTIGGTQSCRNGMQFRNMGFIFINDPFYVHLFLPQFRFIILSWSYFSSLRSFLATAATTKQEENAFCFGQILFLRHHRLQHCH